jgi:hypothetical protein
MENPATWGPLEHVVDAALDQAEKNHAAGLVGLSRTRIITDAMRQWLAEPDEATVERVAAALYLGAGRQLYDAPATWRSLESHEADEWRSEARAALAAIGEGTR